MRFYNRFSTEFGSHDEAAKDDDEHHIDHTNVDTEADELSKIYLSMIPYQLREESIKKIKNETL